MPHHPNQPIHHAPARRIPGSVALLIWAWLTLLLFAAAAVAEPFQPTSDGVVLEQLPQQPALARGTIGRLAAQLVADPQDLNLAVALARQYMQLGRAAADPRYYGYAEAALAPWWTLARPPRDVAVLRAVARQFQHDFDGALGDLAYVLQTDPAHPQALLSRAVIQQVQGHYAAALRTCARLPRQVPPLVVTACAAGAASLSGDAAASYDALSRRLDEQPDAAPELRQWALTILAEIAERAGDTTASERHFRAALALDAHSGYLLGAYADLLLDAGRYDDVRTLLRDDVRSDPLLLRLALAEAASGSHHWAATPRATAHVATLESRFAASRRRGDSRHLREEARFTLELLRRPDEALRLALDNWRTQREPWDARLVLEAALAAGTPTAAGPVVESLRRAGLEDARIAPLIARLEEAGT